MTTSTVVRGLPVLIVNTRPDIATEAVVRRLDQALALLQQYARHHYRHFQRDFAQIIVQRYACRGAYIPGRQACLVELTFTVNPDFTASQIAATILHEAMHARLHRLGFVLERGDRARQERFCRRAEIEFGLAVPDGAPIVARALGALQASDEDVAPTIDPVLAARRVAEADLQASRAPTWLKRVIAVRRGLAALLGTWLVTGACYAYRPVAQAPTPGTRVRIVFNSAIAVATRASVESPDSTRRMHLDVLEASGTIQAAAGDTVALQLGELRTAAGSLPNMSGRIALLPTMRIARIEERRFQAGTTVLAGAGVATLALATYLVLLIVVLTKGI
jgi:hypothetical protein